MEYIARAVIKDGDKILLCHAKKAGHWYFPGGHIEEGESAPQALIREISEEIGSEARILGFLGASENKYLVQEIQVHEINLIFHANLKDPEAITSREEHIEFAWFTPEEFRTLERVLPSSLHQAVLSKKEGEPLWVSEGF